MAMLLFFNVFSFFILILHAFFSLIFSHAAISTSSSSTSLVHNAQFGAMAAMESLIALVNRIQRACTVLGDYGGEYSALPTIWETLPSVVVVGGQVIFALTFIDAFCCMRGFIYLFCLCLVGNVELWKIIGVGEHCWS